MRINLAVLSKILIRSIKNQNVSVKNMIRNYAKNIITIRDELLSKVNLDSQDMTKWELTDRLSNKFNRLVLYRGDFFHMSLDYFGQDMNDGRLFQTFFFDD